MTSLPPNDPLAPWLADDEPTLAGEYWRLWQLGEPDLEAYLAGRPRIAPQELAAIVQVDLRQRWLRDQRPAADEYLTRFPQLADDADLAVDVIFEEFLAREQRQEDPQLAEFQERFPRLATILADQILFHCAVNDCEADASGQARSTSAADDPTFSAPEARPDRSGRLQGDYEILKEIGRGGMGIVFQARQVGLNRLVALKMVRAADRGNPELLARFRAEAEVVASLHHSHIVQIYDYGEHDGLPYLALEWIEGGTLASRLDGKPWPPRRAATLLAELARAVHFAHERRVIHRDLKPANLLVASEVRGLEIKIADFGLAKVFRDAPSAEDTQTGALLGTPSYMAPEQAGGRTRDIGPTTDVYALGAILYELLSGRPPFRGETSIETLQQVLTVEPVSIHRLVPRVPHDLATICAKCLAREPGRRYPSAAELADDLTRFLADQPIHARRTGRVERGWRWCRRNPSLAAALGSVAALLLAVAAVSTWYSGRLSGQLAVTRQAEQTAQVRLWDAYLAEIAALNASHQVGQRFAALESVDKALGLLDTIGRTDERILKIRSATLNSLALPDFRRLRSVADIPDHTRCSVSAAADLYVAATAARELVGVRLSDGRQVFKVQHRGAPVAPAISPDGRFVTAVGTAGTEVWRIDGPQPVLAWHKEAAYEFAFAPDGRYGATSEGEAGMRLVDVASGATVRALGHGAATSSFSFHAASRRVAVCAEGSVQVISCDTGEVLAEWPDEKRIVRRVAWHPDGKFVAAWELMSGAIALWDVQARKRVVDYHHLGFPWGLHFSADGSRLLSYTLWDQRLILSDVGTGRKLLDLRGFASFACDLADREKAVLLRSIGSTVELWEFATASECLPLAGALDVPLGSCHRVSASPDNRLLAVSRDLGLELWDLHTCRRVAASACGLCMAEFDAAGDLIVACKAGVFHWPRTDSAPLAGESADDSRPAGVVRFGPPRRLSGPVDPTSLSGGPIKSVMAFAERGDWTVMDKAAPQKKVRLAANANARRAAVSHNEQHVALANWEAGGATVYATASGQRLLDLTLGPHVDLQFSPDGRYLATTPDGVRLWRVADWQLARELHASGTYPTGLGIAFSPDSRVLAIGQPDGVLRLVDPQSGADWARLTHRDLSCASRIVFSPNQTRLVTLPHEGDLPGWIWNLAAMRSELVKRGLDWPGDILPGQSGPPADPPSRVVLDDGGLLLLMDILDRPRPVRKAAAGR